MIGEEYIMPELLVLIPVLYIIGNGLKNSSAIKDKHIPFVIGGSGIIIAMLYECSVLGFSFEAMYTAVIQGILCAGMSVYAHQSIKQIKKDE